MKLNRFLILWFLAAMAVWPLSSSAQPSRILVLQHQSFGPYDEARAGFHQGLSELEGRKDITVDHFNPEGDLKLLDQKIASIGSTADIDLIFSLGTVATKRVIHSITEIPVIFTGLGAPEYSGIVKDWKSSGANFTGVDTPGYVSLGINLLFELTGFKRLGMIYLKGSPSHDGSIAQVKRLAGELGFEFIHDGFALRDADGKKHPKARLRKNIKESLDRVLPKVDVFFVQLSKSFSSNFDLFREAFIRYKIPTAGDFVYINEGIVMGIGRNNLLAGVKCAQYAEKILGGKKPSSLPMDGGVDFQLAINIAAADLVDYNPPIDLVTAADTVYNTLDY